MKKTKSLALVLVVAIMMMGAGYAYWTEDLTINTTVDTGILDVTFEEPANIDDENVDQPNADVSPDGHTMSVTFNDIYPGVSNTIYFDMVNNGTLGAYVDDFEITPTTDFDVTNVIRCYGLRLDGVTIPMFSTSTNGVPLTEVIRTLNAQNNGNGVSVEKDGEVKVELDLRFSEEADEDTLPEDDNFTFEISSKVYQFNGR